MHNSRHKQQDCIETALLQAKNLCQAHQQRLTPMREQVLRCISLSQQAIGAYSIIDVLGKQSLKSPSPPTIYRALDFLLDMGLIHRIHSLNAFIACKAPGHPHSGQPLTCRHCQNTVELLSQRLNQEITQLAAQYHFHLEPACVELSGLCQACQVDANTL